MHVLRHSVCVCINGLGVHRVLLSERLSVLPHCGELREILLALRSFSPHFTSHQGPNMFFLTHTAHTTANKTKALCLEG